MNWIYLASTTVVLFTVLNLLQRKIASASSNPRVAATLFNCIAGIVAVTIFILSGGLTRVHFPSNPLAYLGLLIASVCYGMFERGRFQAAKLLDASVFATITNVALVTAFLSSLFLYHEAVTVSKIIGGLLIMIALVVVSYERHNHVSSKKGLLIGTLISIFLGFGWTMDKFGALNFTPEIYNLLIWTVPILIVIFPLVPLTELRKELSLSGWKVLLLAGINVLGYYAQLNALNLSEVTRVIPYVQTSTLWTVILGIIILKEKEHIAKKIMAGILAIIGVYFLI